MAGRVRAQEWIADLTPAKAKLVKALAEADQAARASDRDTELREIFDTASQQPWYSDGLDDTEALCLAGVYDAFAASVSDYYAPDLGDGLLTTLRYRLFALAPVDGSADPVPVLVSAADPEQGSTALQLATTALGKIQPLVGPYPYPFMHLQVTDELPLILAGVASKDFIGISTYWVDAPTITHEVTHSTVYGIFPTWFEEGLAHFTEFYLTGSLDDGKEQFTDELDWLGVDDRLDIRPVSAYSWDAYMADRAEGFLLIKSIFEIDGQEAFSRTLHSLRKQSYSDQQTLAAFVEQAGSADAQAQMKDLFCKRLIGSMHDYCH